MGSDDQLDAMNAKNRKTYQHVIKDIQETRGWLGEEHRIHGRLMEPQRPEI